MRIEIEFDTDNAAFVESGDAFAEPARLVRGVSERLAEGFTSGELRDYNGNRVGTWAITSTV